VAVDELREDHGGCGLEKIYRTLRPDFLGRDRFIALFQELGYGLKRRPKGFKTTFSSVFRYDNLIEGRLLYDIDQLWQSDITYIRVGEEFYYAIFIIDVYSKRILSHLLSDHMFATANLKALKAAFKARKKQHFPQLIHHSDRGSQYGAKCYTTALEAAQVAISMGKKAQENAYAEKVNGTIKNEYLAYRTFTSFKQLKRELSKAVNHYNQGRIHNHLPHDQSPLQFEQALRRNPERNRPFIIVHAQDRPQYLWVKNNKLTTFNSMEKNAFFGVCPLTHNHIFFNQNGQH